MKSKNLFKLFLSVLVLFGITAVVQAGTRGVSKNEILLGMHTALSGPVAGWGIDVSSGTRMRFDEANAAGGIHGRKIRLIVEDSQYRVPIAVQKANKLVNRDKVFFLIGSIGTPHNKAAFKMMEKKNVPSVFPLSASRAMSQPFHRLRFAHMSTLYDNARASVKYFIEEKGKKRPCMMYMDTDYGMETVDALRDQLAIHKMDLVGVTSHKPTETNFVGAISKLRKAKCDVIIMGTIIRDTIIPASTARKMGWNVDMVANTSACNAIVSKNGGKGVEGLYAATANPVLYADQPMGKKARAFFDNYRKRFGKEPSSISMLGYTDADLAVLAMERAGPNLTVSSLIKALESIKGYKHIFGGADISFSSSRHDGASGKSILYQIQDGKWQPLAGKTQIIGY